MKSKLFKYNSVYSIENKLSLYLFIYFFKDNSIYITINNLKTFVMISLKFNNITKHSILNYLKYYHTRNSFSYTNTYIGILLLFQF